ncbi:MAG: MFS transporter, partial [Silvanigrellaceae bacterium]|nr:MFS transporter [Silvanigrellaceae bacterium]
MALSGYALFRLKISFVDGLMVIMKKNTNTSQRMISLIVALSFFMEALDSTVINTAIPAMSRSLMVDPVDLKVALISYLLSLALFIPISGWLSDRFGAKRVFIVALITFTLSSLGCGFANNLTTLVVARFIQGLGGALGLPVGRLILIRTFGRENMITTM